MASFGGLNRKRMHGSAISSTQKRIKICVYDKPPRVGAPSRGCVRSCPLAQQTVRCTE